MVDEMTAIRRMCWDGAIVFGVRIPPATKVGRRDRHYTDWYDLLINKIIPGQMGRPGMDAFIDAGFSPLIFFQRHSEEQPEPSPNGHDDDGQEPGLEGRDDNGDGPGLT